MPQDKPPQDEILADLLLEQQTKKWIVRYHEHDCLLAHIEGEELTTADQEDAWKAHLERRSNRPDPAAAMAQFQQLQQHSRHAQHVQQLQDRLKHIQSRVAMINQTGPARLPVSSRSNLLYDPRFNPAAMAHYQSGYAQSLAMAGMIPTGVVSGIPQQDFSSLSSLRFSPSMSSSQLPSYPYGDGRSHAPQPLPSIQPPQFLGGGGDSPDEPTPQMSFGPAGGGRSGKAWLQFRRD